MTSLESSGLNAGYVGQLLEQYLENPEAVDPAWRALFEEGDGELLSALPGLERLVRTRGAGSGNGPVTVENVGRGYDSAHRARRRRRDPQRGGGTCVGSDGRGAR